MFLPNFDDGVLCYVTISTSSRYVSMIGFTEKNRDEDDDNNDNGDIERPTDE